MKKTYLTNYKGGWIVGDFQPNILQNKQLEVGLKYYKKGFIDKPHYHKYTDEFTIIIRGTAEICGEKIEEGTIVHIEPSEVANFKAITDVTTLVIKSPSLPDDKIMMYE